MRFLEFLLFYIFKVERETCIFVNVILSEVNLHRHPLYSSPNGAEGTGGKPINTFLYFSWFSHEALYDFLTLQVVLGGFEMFKTHLMLWNITYNFRMDRMVPEDESPFCGLITY